MIKQQFSHVRYWVFDLDNTLYPPHARLFDQIEVRMTDYVQTALGVDKKRADYLRGYYWKKYGTTLAGLMREHDVDPAPYLTHVHDISLDHLEIDQNLAAYIGALPGRKIVFTNGSRPYAQNVLRARGLDNLFDAVYGVEHANFHPKPEKRAFETVFDLDGGNPAQGAMFEDDHRNLIAPHQMGMACVYVSPETRTDDHIHHHTDDLTAFLKHLIS